MKNYLLFSTAPFTRPVGFDGGKWKVDAAGNVVLTDGKATYIGDDGKEVTIDPSQLLGKITELNNEAANHRRRAETAEGKLKVFGEIDPEKAKAALELVGNLDTKKLMDAGEVEKVKAEIAKGFTEQITTRDAKINELTSNNHNLVLDGAFASSKFIADKIAVPVGMFKAAFRNNFSIGDDGKIVSKDASGNIVYSKTSPGNVADFEEALTLIVDNYPDKNSILKGGGQSGSGSGGAGGTSRPGQKRLTRSEFNTLNPMEQVAFSKEVKSGTAVLTNDQA